MIEPASLASLQYPLRCLGDLSHRNKVDAESRELLQRTEEMASSLIGKVGLRSPDLSLLPSEVPQPRSDSSVQRSARQYRETRQSSTSAPAFLHRALR